MTLTAEREQEIRERVAKVPTILTLHRAPWYTSMDGVKDANQCWMFKADGPLDSRLAELANDASASRQDIPDLLAALTAAKAENERLRLLQEFAEDLAWRSYLGVAVLKTVLKKSKLETGADVSEKLLADIAIQYPHFPAKSALRTTARTVAKVENGAFTASFKRERDKRSANE